MEWFEWRDEDRARGRTLLALFDDVARGRVDRSTSEPLQGRATAPSSPEISAVLKKKLTGIRGGRHR
jgi:hypothetical protein